MAGSIELAAMHSVREANRRAYGAADTVSGYLAGRYHRRRREIAVQMLVRGVRAADAGRDPGLILELGVGSVNMLTGAQTASLRFIVADLEFDALQAARQGSAMAVCLDATRPLPFSDGLFAGVLMGELIEHIFDPIQLLTECYRVLKPAGVLVFTTPNLAGLQDRLRFVRGKSPRHVDPLHPYLRLHIRPFTKTMAERMLRHLRFEPTGTRSNYVGWQLPNRRWLTSRLLARIAPGLGGSLIVSARKPAVGYPSGFDG